MANNRLYIVDTETNEYILLAKSNGDGWWVWYAEDKAERVDILTTWLELRDLSASYGNTDSKPSRLTLMAENDPAFAEIVEAEKIKAEG